MAMCDAYLAIGPLRVARSGEVRWLAWPLLALAACLAGDRRLHLALLPSLPGPAYHATAAAGLVVALPLVSAPLRRALNAGPLVWLGRVSFGLYLVHAAMIGWVATDAYLALRRSAGWSHAAAAMAACAITLPLCLVAGWAFHHVADRPSVAVSRWAARLIPGPATG